MRPRLHLVRGGYLHSRVAPRGRPAGAPATSPGTYEHVPHRGSLGSKCRGRTNGMVHLNKTFVYSSHIYAMVGFYILIANAIEIETTKKKVFVSKHTTAEMLK